MAKFNGSEFMRQVYLHSNPSVDLNDVPSEHPINGEDYTIKQSEFDAILHQMGVTDENGNAVDPNSDLLMACFMWAVNKGPVIIDDSKSA